MILERPAYPLPPASGPRDDREVSRVLGVMSAGHLNCVIDLDLSGETSPYVLENANISEFSWIRPMHDGVSVGQPTKQSVEVTWIGTGPSICRLLVIG